MENKEDQIRFIEILDQIRQRFDLLLKPSNAHSSLDFDVIREDIRNLYRCLDTLQFVRNDSHNASGLGEIKDSSLKIPELNAAVSFQEEEHEASANVHDNTENGVEVTAARTDDGIESGSENKAMQTEQQTNISSNSQSETVLQKPGNAPVLNQGRLSRFIGLNDKFQIVRQLFNGEESAYLNFIQAMEKFEDLESAEKFLVEEVCIQRNWDPESEAFKNLSSITIRYFS